MFSNPVPSRRRSSTRLSLAVLTACRCRSGREKKNKKTLHVRVHVDECVLAMYSMCVLSGCQCVSLVILGGGSRLLIKTKGVLVCANFICNGYAST